jgi:methionine aminopeptidase
LLSYGHPPPGCDIFKGVYSDDIAQIAIGVESDEALKSRRRDLCEATVSAHEAAGTVLREGKRVRDAKHHIVWAGELDSDKQRASGEVDTIVNSVVSRLLPVFRNTSMPAAFLRSCRHGFT